jgi:hypothetical protein
MHARRNSALCLFPFYLELSPLHSNWRLELLLPLSCHFQNADYWSHTLGCVIYYSRWQSTAAADLFHGAEVNLFGVPLARWVTRPTSGYTFVLNTVSRYTPHSDFFAVVPLYLNWRYRTDGVTHHRRGVFPFYYSYERVVLPQDDNDNDNNDNADQQVHARWMFASLALLPPYVVLAESETSRQLHVFPFYGRMDNGVRTLTYYAFPLVLHRRTADEVSWYVLNLYHWRTDTVRTHGVWPFYRHRVDSAEETVTDYLAPLWYYWYSPHRSTFRLLGVLYHQSRTHSPDLQEWQRSVALLGSSHVRHTPSEHTWSSSYRMLGLSDALSVLKLDRIVVDQEVRQLVHRSLRMDLVHRWV